MGDEKSSFPDGVRDYAEGQRRGLGEHPSAETLVAYRERRLPAAEAERVADHLALCRECGDLLLDLGDFEDPALPGMEAPEPGDDEEAAWQALRARMQGAPAPEVEPRTGEPAEERPDKVREIRKAGAGGAPARARLALAASVLLAVIGFGWGGVQWHRARQAGGAYANPPLVELFPEEDHARGEGEVVSVPADAEKFLLVLTPPEGPAREYDAEVLDEAGGKVTQKRLREREGQGTLTLLLDREAVPPGSYTVDLLLPGDRQKITSYKFRVEGR